MAPRFATTGRLWVAVFRLIGVAVHCDLSDLHLNPRVRRAALWGGPRRSPTLGRRGSTPRRPPLFCCRPCGCARVALYISAFPMLHESCACAVCLQVAQGQVPLAMSIRGILAAQIEPQGWRLARLDLAAQAAFTAGPS